MFPLLRSNQLAVIFSMMLIIGVITMVILIERLLLTSHDEPTEPTETPTPSA